MRVTNTYRVHAHGRPAVKIAARLEGGNHAGAPRHVRQNAQFELPIVGHDEPTAGRGGERLADAVHVLFERGLVLQIRPTSCRGFSDQANTKKTKKHKNQKLIFHNNKRNAESN